MPLLGTAIGTNQLTPNTSQQRQRSEDMQTDETRIVSRSIHTRLELQRRLLLVMGNAISASRSGVNEVFSSEDKFSRRLFRQDASSRCRSLQKCEVLNAYLECASRVPEEG